MPELACTRLLAVIDSDGFRPNVGIILTNDVGQVLWARRINQDAGGVHIVTGEHLDDSADVVARVIGPSCAMTDALSTAAICGIMGNWSHFEGYEARAIVLDNP